MTELAPHPARDTAIADLNSTSVPAGLARAMTAVFLLAIGTPLLLEVALRGDAPARVAALVQPLGDETTTAFAAARLEGAGLFASVVRANREVLRVLHGIDEAAEGDTVLSRTLRGPVQFALTHGLGAGNEQTYVGRDGWLFYRPDVDHLTLPGFLTTDRLNDRVDNATAWTDAPRPDPRPAILDFARQLQARGITLVLVPVPGKPALEPDRLSGRYLWSQTALANPSFATFVTEVERAGVLVFDTGGAIAAARGPGRAYLAADTHWRPEIVERVAESLIAFLHTRAGVVRSTEADYRVAPADVAGAGDTAVLLDLPPGWRDAAPERVTVRRVLDSSGAPWRASHGADVLLLGDSFTNMFSLASLGWGDSGGFAEHLSFTLGRPIDRVVQNDQAAFATRALLADQIAAQPDRLAGVRVVIYQFATRELTLGDWKMIGLGLR